MKKWLQYKYYKIQHDKNLMPLASHCFKPHCRDNNCSVIKEMMKVIRWHYTGVWR